MSLLQSPFFDTHQVLDSTVALEARERAVFPGPRADPAGQNVSRYVGRGRELLLPAKSKSVVCAVAGVQSLLALHDCINAALIVPYSVTHSLTHLLTH